MDDFEAILETLTDEQKDYLAMGVVLGSAESANNIITAYAILDDPKEALIEYANAILDGTKALSEKMVNVK